MVIVRAVASAAFAIRLGWRKGDGRWCARRASADPSIFPAGRWEAAWLARLAPPCGREPSSSSPRPARPGPCAALSRVGECCLHAPPFCVVMSGYEPKASLPTLPPVGKEGKGALRGLAGTARPEPDMLPQTPSLIRPRRIRAANVPLGLGQPKPSGIRYVREPYHWSLVPACSSSSPAERVSGNVLLDTCKRVLVANDVFVVSALPDSCARCPPRFVDALRYGGLDGPDDGRDRPGHGYSEPLHCGGLFHPCRMCAGMGILPANTRMPCT